MTGRSASGVLLLIYWPIDFAVRILYQGKLEFDLKLTLPDDAEVIPLVAEHVAREWQEEGFDEFKKALLDSLEGTDPLSVDHADPEMQEVCVDYEKTIFEAVEKGELLLYGKDHIQGEQAKAGHADWGYAYSEGLAFMKFILWAERKLLPIPKDYRYCFHPAIPDWPYWLMFETWTLEEAVSLVLGYAPGSSEGPLKTRIYTLAKSAVGTEALPTEVDNRVKPVDFLRWCQGNGIEIPEPLQELLEPATDTGAADAYKLRPEKYTTAKIWHTKGNAFHLSTKTGKQGRRMKDGRIDFPPNQKGEITKQARLIRHLALGHPDGVRIWDITEDLYGWYPGERTTRQIKSVTKKLRSTLSTLRRKLEDAGIPDILPSIDIDQVAGNSEVKLRVAWVHKWDEWCDLPCDTGIPSIQADETDPEGDELSGSEEIAPKSQIEAFDREKTAPKREQ